MQDTNSPQLERFAVVASNAPSIEAYMPANYRVLGHFPCGDAAWTLIGGYDEAGWTLEDYIIPRLASGLYWAWEVTPSAAKTAVSA